MRNNTEKNIACEIIGDLLPLYHDGVVSEVTSEAVKSHLEACPSCTKEYKALYAPLPAEASEASTGSRFSDVMKKLRRKNIIVTVIISVIACTILAGAFYLLTQVPIVKVDDSKIKISRVYAYETDEGAKLYVMFQKPLYEKVSRFNTDVTDTTYAVALRRPVISKEILMIDDGCIIPVGEYSEIIFAGKTIWSEGDAVNSDIPDYVYAYDDFNNHTNVNGWSTDLKSGYVCAQYENGRTVKWDLDGNVLSDAQE